MATPVLPNKQGQKATARVKLLRYCSSNASSLAQQQQQQQDPCSTAMAAKAAAEQNGAHLGLQRLKAERQAKKAASSCQRFPAKKVSVVQR
jgi:hypothetical protein